LLHPSAFNEKTSKPVEVGQILRFIQTEMVSSLPDNYVTANVSHRQPQKTNKKPALYKKCAQILLALRIIIMQMVPQYFMIP